MFAFLSSFRTTSIVKFATILANAPTAAKIGAQAVPITPIVSGISINVFPVSSLIIILLIFPSFISSSIF